MFRTNNLLVLLAVLIGIAALPGCGSGNAASVQGVVTLDGVTVKAGTVTFHPVQEGPRAYGQIGLDGSYQLSTGSDSGIIPGEYIVTVVGTEPLPPNMELESQPPPPITPARYASRDESDLRRTVTKGANKIDLPLTTQPTSE